MEPADHLWLPFLAQTQSDVVVFAIISFDSKKNIVTKWEYGISTNYKITLNKT